MSKLSQFMGGGGNEIGDIKEIFGKVATTPYHVLDGRLLSSEKYPQLWEYMKASKATALPTLPPDYLDTPDLKKESYGWSRSTSLEIDGSIVDFRNESFLVDGDIYPRTTTSTNVNNRLMIIDYSNRQVDVVFHHGMNSGALKEKCVAISNLGEYITLSLSSTASFANDGVYYILGESYSGSFFEVVHFADTYGGNRNYNVGYTNLGLLPVLSDEASYNIDKKSVPDRFFPPLLIEKGNGRLFCSEPHGIYRSQGSRVPTGAKSNRRVLNYNFSVRHFKDENPVATSFLIGDYIGEFGHVDEDRELLFGLSPKAYPEARESFLSSSSEFYKGDGESVHLIKPIKYTDEELLERDDGLLWIAEGVFSILEVETPEGESRLFRVTNAELGGVDLFIFYQYLSSVPRAVESPTIRDVLEGIYKEDAQTATTSSYTSMHTVIPVKDGVWCFGANNRSNLVGNLLGTSTVNPSLYRSFRSSQLSGEPNFFTLATYTNNASSTPLTNDYLNLPELNDEYGEQVFEARGELIGINEFHVFTSIDDLVNLEGKHPYFNKGTFSKYFLQSKPIKFKEADGRFTNGYYLYDNPKMESVRYIGEVDGVKDALKTISTGSLSITDLPLRYVPGGFCRERGDIVYKVGTTVASTFSSSEVKYIIHHEQLRDFDVSDAHTPSFYTRVTAGWDVDLDYRDFLLLDMSKGVYYLTRNIGGVEASGYPMIGRFEWRGGDISLLPCSNEIVTNEGRSLTLLRIEDDYLICEDTVTKNLCFANISESGDVSEFLLPHVPHLTPQLSYAILGDDND